MRHGLTAETVIGALEDAGDYKAFEAAIIAGYDAQSAVERELVLRLASVLWRLRRATTMETGLFEVQAQHLRDYRQNCGVAPRSHDVTHALLRPGDSTSLYGVSHSAVSKIETMTDSTLKADASVVEFARCFLRLANLPNFALDRLSRYEATLWRQAGRILFALDALHRLQTPGVLNVMAEACPATNSQCSSRKVFVFLSAASDRQPCQECRQRKDYGTCLCLRAC